ncbi:hypothetical protein BY458DRAFT_354035 [Sporodiniella umbellata]|nr:hypothetical protein BY458DRAFT_354035 [Sporodiniella umbellata]
MDSDSLSISFASGLGIDDVSAKNPRESEWSSSLYSKRGDCINELGDPTHSSYKTSKWPLQSQKVIEHNENEDVLLPEIQIRKPFTRMTSSDSKERFIKSTEIKVNRKRKDSVNKLLEAQFKTLPLSLENTFDTDTKDIKFNNQPQRSQVPCIVEPKHIHFQCEMKQDIFYSDVAQLKLKNMSQKEVSFSFFSSNGLLDFEMSEGKLMDLEEMAIEIRLKRESVQKLQPEQTSDKLLVLIDQSNAVVIDVTVNLVKTESNTPQKPKCPYCIIETGFPSHYL